MYTLFLKRFEPMGVISATSERTLCDLLSSSSNKTLPCMYLKQTMVSGCGEWVCSIGIGYTIVVEIFLPYFVNV